MADDLKIGDMVMIIKNTGPASFDWTIGIPTMVKSIEQFLLGKTNGKIFKGYTLELHCPKTGLQIGAERQELLKIEPITDQEEILQDEELTA